MSYSKHTWIFGEKVTSERLNHMEEGIESAQITLDNKTLITNENGEVQTAVGGYIVPKSGKDYYLNPESEGYRAQVLYGSGKNRLYVKDPINEEKIINILNTSGGTGVTRLKLRLTRNGYIERDGVTLYKINDGSDYRLCEQNSLVEDAINIANKYLVDDYNLAITNISGLYESDECVVEIWEDEEDEVHPIDARVVTSACLTHIDLNKLPTSDPHNAGDLYYDPSNKYLKVSLG